MSEWRRQLRWRSDPQIAARVIRTIASLSEAGKLDTKVTWQRRRAEAFANCVYPNDYVERQCDRDNQIRQQ
jgi:hypothetical protein